MTAQIALVSPIEVKKHLNNDARPYSKYVAGYIPGAVWMSWEGWCEKAPTRAGRTLAQAGYWGGAQREHNWITSRIDETDRVER
jgi:3-mercaptopyruvate sulfurtransferase SseA